MSETCRSFVGAGLYDPAFSTLGRLYGDQARSAITHVTLHGGFAGPVCWPFSVFFVEQVATTARWAVAQRHKHLARPRCRRSHRKSATALFSWKPGKAAGRHAYFG